MGRARTAFWAVLALCALVPPSAAARTCADADLEPSAAAVSRAQAAVACLVSAEREAQGLAPFTRDARLDVAATLHAQDMRARGFFDHEAPAPAPNGVEPWDRMLAAGFSWAAASENIALGQRTPRDVVVGWFESAGHCRNFLSATTTHLGVGVAPGARPHWVAVMGRPRAAAASAGEGPAAGCPLTPTFRGPAAGSGEPSHAAPSGSPAAPASKPAARPRARLRLTLRRLGPGRVRVAGSIAPASAASRVRVVVRRGSRRVVRTTTVRAGRFALTVRAPRGRGNLRASARPASNLNAQARVHFGRSI